MVKLKMIIKAIPPPPKKSIEILAIFEKVSLNLRKQNHISGSLNEVLTTR